MASVSGASQKINSTTRFEIQTFRVYEKNTLRGFLDIITPGGMVIHGLTLHQKGESRWIGMPAKEFKKEDGSKGWTPIIEFSTRQIADTFRDNVLEALDRHLEGGF